MSIKRNSTSPDNLKYVRVNDLLLDSNNPRFPEGIRGADQQVILDRMIDREQVTDLINSIGSQGYFEGEPLLAVEKGEQYVVVEGNRRTAALMLLQEPSRANRKKRLVAKLVEDAEHKPELIPVLVYEKRAEILKYLGYRHVTGIKSWGSLEKARYLHMLLASGHYDNLESGDKYRELARAIGSNAHYVRKLLGGLNLFFKIESNDFFDIDELNEETFNFSLLTTAIGYNDIAVYIGLTASQDIVSAAPNANFETLIRWIYEKDTGGSTRLGESRNLQKLNAIIQNPNALSKFEGGMPLEKAVYYTEEPIKDYRKLIAGAREQLQYAWETLAPLSSEGFSNDDVKQLEAIENMIGNLLKFVSQDE